jgi:hypothetical protein
MDLAMGLIILGLAILPLAYSFARERHVLRIEYCQAIASEIVDGEMEILAAGAARDIPDGTRNYPIHSAAANQLPPGHFQLTKTGNHLRLEWVPDARHGIGAAVVRETTLQ